MEFAGLVELIPTLGFPIVIVLILFGFIYKIYNDMEKSKSEAEARSLERETWLHGVVKDAQATNAQFAEVIAKYDSKLDKIQEDVSEIKTDIIEIKASKN